jgi:hypothetical protein
MCKVAVMYTKMLELCITHMVEKSKDELEMHLIVRQYKRDRKVMI